MTSLLPSSDNLKQISVCWELLTTTFGDLTCTHSSFENETVLQNKDIIASLHHLFSVDLVRSFVDWYFNEIAQYLKDELVEPFKNKSVNILKSHHAELGKSEIMKFDDFDAKIWGNLLNEINAMIKELHTEIYKIEQNVFVLGALLNELYKTNECDEQLKDRLHALIDSVFLMDGFEDFESLFAVFFEYSLIHFNHVQFADNLMNEFAAICNVLHNLRWLKVFESQFIDVCYGEIERELSRNYKAKKNGFVNYSLFERPLLSDFKKWANEICIKWLNEFIYAQSEKKADVAKFEYFCFEKFGRMRMKEMFDIILIYPQSLSALEDLKKCLNVSSEWRPFQIWMLSSFKKRLLHHGASSKDIVACYIATIGALKVLDPTGVSMEIIGDSMRTYLRERDDAIRCVVAHLMENENGCLLKEFRAKLASKKNANNNERDVEMEWNEEQTNKECAERANGNESDDSMDSDFGDAKEWKPDPLDSVFIKAPIFKHNEDTIGLLVKIFGSRELFVDEYRKFLAERLLSRHSDFYRIDKESEYLELMKLRFGEESMGDCNVMIADIVNSERDKKNILQITNEPTFDCTIISSQYWPQNKIESEQKMGYLTKKMEKIYKKYECVYSEIKKPRKMHFLAQHGSVDLELQLNGVCINVQTKPINASLLMYFMEECGEKCIKTEVLQNKFGENELNYWIKRGVIKRMFDSQSNELMGYRLADGKDEEIYALNCLKKEQNQSKIGGDDDEQFQDSNILNFNASEKESICAEFERTVLGVLTVFQGSPIERIMTLLKQMKLHPIYAKISMNELQNVMDKLTNEKRVIFEDGMYKRSKK